MWTIYGQSLVLLLCEEMILKAWTNSGHTLYMDKLWTKFVELAMGGPQMTQSKLCPEFVHVQYMSSVCPSFLNVLFTQQQIQALSIDCPHPMFVQTLSHIKNYGL